jgi:fumarate hydratase class I
MPMTEEDARSLHAGDAVRLCGILFTARDAVHQRLAAGAPAPCDLRGRVLYHCGPVVVRSGEGWRVTAAGPTTSAREEPYMAAVIERCGIRGILGKGGMGAATLAACGRHGCVYFHAVGGAAQVLAACIRTVRGVYLKEELGAPEAVWELEVDGLPAVVTMDCHGINLHERVAQASAARLQALLGPGKG